MEFKDAIREGDGRRIIRVWKVFMLYFHYARHKNYKHEAFLLISYVNACASPLFATQLKCVMGLCQEFNVDPQSVEHTKTSYAKDFKHVLKELVSFMFLKDFINPLKGFSQI